MKNEVMAAIMAAKRRLNELRRTNGCAEEIAAYQAAIWDAELAMKLAPPDIVGALDALRRIY